MPPKSEQPIYYVYCLYRPTNEPVYIGKGHGERWLAKRTMVKNPHLARIAQAAGGTLRSEKLMENLTEQEALAAEVALIKKIGRDIHGGPLVNLTDGGDGTSGRICSDETRTKMSKALKGMRIPQEAIERAKKTREARLTPERRAKYASFKGRKHTAETKAKMSAAYRPRPWTPEQSSYASSSRKGKPQKRTPEHAANLSAAISARNSARKGIKPGRGRCAHPNQICLEL